MLYHLAHLLIVFKRIPYTFGYRMATTKSNLIISHPRIRLWHYFKKILHDQAFPLM